MRSRNYLHYIVVNIHRVPQIRGNVKGKKGEEREISDNFHEAAGRGIRGPEVACRLRVYFLLRPDRFYCIIMYRDVKKASFREGEDEQ